jgi:hypothetical protein
MDQPVPKIKKMIREIFPKEDSDYIFALEEFVKYLYPRQDIPDVHLLGPSSSFDRELPDWGNRRGGACLRGTSILRHNACCCFHGS